MSERNDGRGQAHRRRPVGAIAISLAMIAAACGSPSIGTNPASSAATSFGPSAAASTVPLPTVSPPNRTPAPEGSGQGSPGPSSAPTAAPLPTMTPVPTTGPTATAPPTARPTATARPTPRPTPRPTATPAPTPSPASRLLNHGSQAGHEVAITLDMGGRVGDALAIMGWLVDHEVHASIFMTGAMADNPNTDAGRRVLAIIDDHPGLFSLGNHSYTHRDFRTLTTAEIRTELRRTEAALAPWCDQDPRPFFRPPNGGYDADVLAAVGAAGYRDTVTWDIDTIDWRPIVNDPPGPTADQIVAKVLGRAQGGSIVLMHLGGYETFAALPRIVAGLRAAGFDLVTLDEMF